VLRGALPAANYYDLLGVDVDASEEDIRAAYRRKAKQLHPDVNKEVRYVPWTNCTANGAGGLRSARCAMGWLRQLSRQLGRGSCCEYMPCVC
jgi:hypothetical protein